jgi:hypothetical protein
MKAGRLLLMAIAALAASPSLCAFTEEKSVSKPWHHFQAAPIPAGQADLTRR